MQRVDVPVLIVGAGPTGLTAALLLAREGIACRVVERRSWPQRAPAAHVVNARSFEIWRQAGADMQAILAAAKNPQDAGAVYWVTKLGGEELGRLPFERQHDDTLAFTPTPLRNLSQHRLEPLLAEGLRGAKDATLLYSHTWESAVQDADGVTSRLRDLTSGEAYEVRSHYVIAADGAGSPLRKSLGIHPIGPDRIQGFVMIHFEANLRSVVAGSPGVLYFVSDPACSGVFVAHDIDREWVFMHAWDPDNESIEDYTPARCEALVRRAMAADEATLTIRTVGTWMMTSQTAERYGDGRIFLAGDSAHRFPPTGGLGLNTGVQDAHNLVWKLAAVENGWATTRLLETYESERQPIARYNSEQSFTNAARLFEVPQAMGTNDVPERAAESFRQMLADTDWRARVRAAIDNQAEHFDMLGLQLGYCYEAGAIVADGTPLEQGANPVRDFVPSSRPGSRLPHGWVETGARRVSTLDLIRPGCLTLLVGPQGTAWLAAARDVDIPLQPLQVGVDVIDPDDWWTSVARMEADGALLIRPDQHVGFRARGADIDPAGKLRAVCQTILGTCQGATEVRSVV